MTRNLFGWITQAPETGVWSAVGRILSSLLLCSAIALAVISCSSESPVDSDPEVKDLAKEFQDILDNTLQVRGGTGVSAAILMPGEEPWTGASGNSYPSVPITPQTLFGISSVTKVHVAALTLKLAEEGQLNVDGPISQWIGTYAHVDSTITIRQLLSHTSGVFDFIEYPQVWESILYDPSRQWSPEEIVTSFVGDPYFAPGAGFHYSNTNYLLVGMAIEAETGFSISSELRERLWDPLGLDRTFFDVEEVVNGELAHAWIDVGNDGILDDFSSVPRTAVSSATWTAGAVMSTAEDLAKLGQAVYGDGVLSEASLTEMLTDSGFGSGYGLGTDLMLGQELSNGLQIVGQVGSGVGYASVLAYLRDYDVSIAVLVNDNNLDCMLEIASDLVEVVSANRS